MIKVGLCGWTISQREYFERFPVVEIQQTFYDPPPDATIKRWRFTSPPGFEYTLKAWQVITHEAVSPTYRRMKRPFSAAQRADFGAFRWNDTTRAAWELTVHCAKILDATAVVFQCPARFKPTDENYERMRIFFRAAERHGMRFLWEPRGPWPESMVKSLCTELDLVHVVDPFVNPTVTPASVYYRLHGTTGSRHVYSDAELRRLLDMLPAEGDSYVMFNNIPREGDSARFMRLAGG